MSKSRSHDWPDMINMLITYHVTYIGFGNLQRLALRNPQTTQRQGSSNPGSSSCTTLLHPRMGFGNYVLPSCVTPYPFPIPRGLHRFRQPSTSALPNPISRPMGFGNRVLPGCITLQRLLQTALGSATTYYLVAESDQRHLWAAGDTSHFFLLLFFLRIVQFPAADVVWRKFGNAALTIWAPSAPLALQKAQCDVARNGVEC